MKIIGLTGGIACGKSTISQMLSEEGIPIVDADQIVRELQAPTGAAYPGLKSLFGESFFLEDGNLDRKTLAAFVFQNGEAREKLNQLVHPLVREEISLRLKRMENDGEEIAVIDVPLLIESHMEDLADEIWVAYADAPEQLKRLVARDGLTVPQAMSRIRSQMPLSQKILKANVVIDTACSFELLRQRVRDALDKARQP